MKCRRRLAALLMLLLSLAGSARADIFIVINTGNPQPALTQKEVLDIFMGRNRAFANGDFALPFDLPRDSAARSDFYGTLTGMTPAQLNSYWSRLMFTGQTMPPLAMPTEQAVLEMVRRNPSAVGYLSAAPTEKGVRVVLVLRAAK